MATQILPFEPSLLPALKRFAERVWTRPRGDAFYRWRYETLAMHRAWLAVRDGEVLAMECALQRPYRVADETIDILEVFDWYVLPDLRNSGLGVRVMQALMQEGPCLLVGGSTDTQTLLPRLKWQRVDEANRFILPLGAERLGEAIRERVPVPPAIARIAARAALARPSQRPRVRRRPPNGRAIAVASVGEEIQTLYAGPIPYAALPLWPPALLNWLLAGHPSLGHFVPLYFALGDELVGWSLLRIFPAAHGCDAELVECFAPAPSEDLYTWMVSESAVRAAAFSPGRLGACTSCPQLSAALAANGFSKTATNPVQLYWSRPEAPGVPTLIGSNSGDAPLVPFADRWWDAAGG